MARPYDLNHREQGGSKRGRPSLFDEQKRIAMLPEFARRYFRNNKGSQVQIWRGNLSLEVGDEGVAVVYHEWDEDSETEPDTDKWTLTEPDERRTVYNQWNSTWILIDIYE